MIETLQSSKPGDGKKNRPQDFARLYEIIVQVRKMAATCITGVYTNMLTLCELYQLFCIFSME